MPLNWNCRFSAGRSFGLAVLVLLTIGATPLFAQRNGKPTGPSITWVNAIPESGLPEGVTHHTFHFEKNGKDVGYCIYLPSEYHKDSSKRFPVIYNLHGNGGNEFHSFEDVTVLNEGIESGKWPPMIMVFPNGGRSTFYKDSFDGEFPIESMFIEGLIPHIDENYRTIPSREGRCIEGFSMGGRGSTRLAMKYPEMFCSLFCQAGNVPRTAENFDPDTPDTYPNNYLGPDIQNYRDNDAFLLAEKNLKQIRGKLRIQIACGTKDGGHLPTIRDFHQHLVDLGVDHTYIELEDLAHNRKKMIETMSDIWFDYHVESLRIAQEKNSRR
ncbi:alpha/beta hydrolase-fold protein [Thalassoglobus sp. JC818]|uniref:alpha/beta hydrolase n=1 Tax=Thalassoglobus sp. JC818 TaxID=3232136 RepID=UPI003459A037